MLTYEERLSRDLKWALNEGGLHFENRSAVQKALKKVGQRLRELEVPYAVVGAMAMFVHGYRRFTEGVDLLVTKDGLLKIHRELVGFGYVLQFPGSKALRD